ncbi:MAG: hypothetical protein R3B37_08110 [Nitrospira sp.]|nr:hypothetical protein [Nitrospira sp.]
MEDKVSLEAPVDFAESQPNMSQGETISMHRNRRLTTITLVLTAIIMLPLVGPWLAGRSIRPYLEFPPITHAVTHEPFSWIVFSGLALLMVCVIGIYLACQSPLTPREVLSQSAVGRFPWWGWPAIIWTLLAWVLAWTRFEWMRPFQALTFTPLWLGYIVVVNALTCRRIHRCMMLHRPRYFLSLFPLSAAFWWSFEYLNRFVQNWHYLGGEELTVWEYIWQATLPFATVLPAVLGTAELLSVSPRIPTGLEAGLSVDSIHRTRWGWGLFVGAAGGLLGLGLWPDYLFFLVWVAPLVLITGLRMVRGESTIFAEAARGDWRTLWAVALAALICGFFWELWNFYSLAHWEYTVPFVQRFELFHMPLLGYAGYLPFGLECLAVADLCLARKFSGGAAYYYRARAAGTDLAQRKPTVAER